MVSPPSREGSIQGAASEADTRPLPTVRPIFRFPAPKLWRSEFLFVINYPYWDQLSHIGIACFLSPSRLIHTAPLQSVIITANMQMREVGNMAKSINKMLMPARQASVTPRNGKPKVTRRHSISHTVLWQNQSHTENFWLHPERQASMKGWYGGFCVHRRENNIEGPKDQRGTSTPSECSLISTL